jgi:hypothetical protein
MANNIHKLMCTRMNAQEREAVYRARVDSRAAADFGVDFSSEAWGPGASGENRPRRHVSQQRRSRHRASAMGRRHG